MAPSPASLSDKALHAPRMPSASVSGDLSNATAADWLQAQQPPAVQAVAKRPSIATTNAAAVAATAAVASGSALPTTPATAATATAAAAADAAAAAAAAAFTPLKSLLPLHAELTQLCWLGSGSGGRVYSGLWRGSPVAVKILVSSTPDEVRESVREAMLNRVASHPHMVQCFAAFSGYVMEEDVAPRVRWEPPGGAAAMGAAGAAAAGGQQQLRERERKQERERLHQQPQQPQQQQRGPGQGARDRGPSATLSEPGVAMAAAGAGAQAEEQQQQGEQGQGQGQGQPHPAARKGPDRGPSATAPAATDVGPDEVVGAADRQSDSVATAAVDPGCWPGGPESPAPHHTPGERQQQQQRQLSPQQQPQQQKPRPCGEQFAQQDGGQAPQPHSSRLRPPRALQLLQQQAQHPHWRGAAQEESLPLSAPGRASPTSPRVSRGSAFNGAGGASCGPRSAHRPPSPYDTAGIGTVRISGGGVPDGAGAAGGFRSQSSPAVAGGAGAGSGVGPGAGYGMDGRGCGALAVSVTLGGAGVVAPADTRVSFCSYCGAEATTCVCEGPGSERTTPDGDAVAARSDGRSGTGGGGGRGRYVKYAAAWAASGGGAGGGLEYGDVGGGDGGGGGGAGTGSASPSCSLGHKHPSQGLSMGRSGSWRSLRALARTGGAAIAVSTACPELQPNAGVAQGQSSASKPISALCLGLETVAAAAAAAGAGSTGVGSSSTGGPYSPYSGGGSAYDKRSLSLVNLGGASAARVISRTTLTLSDLMGSVVLDEHCASAGELWEVLGATGAQPGRHITVVVMELCDQGTLQQAMQRQQFSAVRSAEQCSALVALLRTALEVAQGMCHLHSLDIVHGDLKPSNVLLQSNAPIATRVGSGRRWEQDHRGYTAKVADFGLAAVQHGTESEACNSGWRQPQLEGGNPERRWGSLPFMAPEVPERGPNKKSDVWAFGMLLYYMCCGRVPYASYGNLRPAQLLMGIVEGSLQLEWPDDTYRLLRRLSETCCQRSAADRPPFSRIVPALQRLIRHVCEHPEPASSPARGASAAETVTATAAVAGGDGDGGGAAAGGSSSARPRLGGGAAGAQGGGSSYSLSLSSLRGGGDGSSYEFEAMRLAAVQVPAAARAAGGALARAPPTEAARAYGEAPSLTGAAAAAPSTEHVPSPLTMFARCLMVPPALSGGGAIGAPYMPSSPHGGGAAAAAALTPPTAIPSPGWQSSGMDRSSMCVTDYSVAVDPDRSSYTTDPTAVGRSPCRGSTSGEPAIAFAPKPIGTTADDDVTLRRRLPTDLA